MTDTPPPDVPVETPLPLSISLPEFEGILPVGVITKLTGTGQRITRPLHYEERGVLVVEYEVVNVQHPKTADGMKRVQVLDVKDFYELEGKPGAVLLRSLRQAYRLADDARKGRKGLPIADLEQPEDAGPGLAVTVAGDGTVLTSTELAEIRGEVLEGLPHVDVAVLVFDDEARALWPDDFGSATGPHPEAGERILKPGAKAKDAPALVRKVLDADTGETLEEWTDEQENERLVELERELAAEELRGDLDAVAELERGRTPKEPALPGEDDEPDDDAALATVSTMNTNRLDAARIMANPEGPGLRAAGSVKADVAKMTDVELVRAIGDLERLGKGRKAILDATEKRIRELEVES